MTIQGITPALLARFSGAMPGGDMPANARNLSMLAHLQDANPLDGSASSLFARDVNRAGYLEAPIDPSLLPGRVALTVDEGYLAETWKQTFALNGTQPEAGKAYPLAWVWTPGNGSRYDYKARTYVDGIEPRLPDVIYGETDGAGAVKFYQVQDARVMVDGNLYDPHADPSGPPNAILRTIIPDLMMGRDSTGAEIRGPSTYEFTTDHKGRTVRATGWIGGTEGHDRNPVAQILVGGEDRQRGVHQGGHLLGNRFGMQGQIFGMTAQDGMVNGASTKGKKMGAEGMTNFEKGVSAVLRSSDGTGGSPIFLDVRAHYGQDGLVPWGYDMWKVVAQDGRPLRTGQPQTLSAYSPDNLPMHFDATDEAKAPYLFRDPNLPEGGYVERFHVRNKAGAQPLIQYWGMDGRPIEGVEYPVPTAAHWEYLSDDAAKGGRNLRL